MIETELLPTFILPSSVSVAARHTHCFQLGVCLGGWGGGGLVAPGRILFVLPKMWSKLERSLMQLLRAKFGKICQWTKKIKDAVVYGWGTQIFPKSPKENKNSLKMSTACLLRNIDHSRSARTFHHCLQKRFISLVRWLRVRPENKPQKNWSVPIFLGLSDRQKKKFALVRPPPPPLGSMLAASPFSPFVPMPFPPLDPFGPLEPMFLGMPVFPFVPISPLDPSGRAPWTDFPWDSYSDL